MELLSLHHPVFYVLAVHVDNFFFISSTIQLHPPPDTVSIYLRMKTMKAGEVFLVGG